MFSICTRFISRKFAALHISVGGDCSASINHAPTLAAIANVTAQQGNSVEVPFTASDADGDPITTTATATNADGTPWSGTLSVVGSKLTLTPPAGFAGRVTVRLAASDGKATSPQTFSVDWQAGPITLEGRDIVIRGTERDDTATIRTSDGQIVVEVTTDGVLTTRSFAVELVDRVRASLFDGADWIENQTAVSMNANGGV